MNTIINIIRKTILVYICYYLALFPVITYATPLVEVSGDTDTTLRQTRNKVNIIDIAAPNGNGLSHNKFNRYNVDVNKHGKNDLILNNSTVNSKTQLSGWVVGNDKFTNNSATVILNEVVSTNGSSLNGATEIAGQRADLIIANPNGISINGAKFINAGDVTMTTGKPNIAGGNVSSFDVNGGEITIHGNGLDVDANQSANIYANYLRLNGAINAQKLDIKLGNNTIDNNGNITSTRNKKSEQLLLDSNNLGGMYANEITLVGTGKGLGVKLPPEVVATTNGVTITNDGKIIIQQLQAKANATINSKEDSIEIIEANAKHNANNNFIKAKQITLTAKKDVVNNARIEAENSIDINAKNALNNQATIITTATNSDININTANNLTNSGYVVSSGQLAITAKTVDNNANSLIGAAKSIDISATDAISNHADIIADGGITLNTSTLTNTQGISARDALIINAKTIDNNHASSVIASNANATINTTGDITNKGRISATKVIDIKTNNNNITNDGQINAGVKLNISNTNMLTNNNLLYSADEIALIANNINNNNNATIQSNNTTTITANSITNNNATIKSTSGALIITASDILTNKNNAKIYAANATITAKTVYNNTNAIIGAAKSIDINATGAISNHADITADGELTLNTSGKLSNSKIISAKGITINAGSVDNNGANAIIASGKSAVITTTKGNIDNSGRISTRINLETNTNNYDISNTGQINAGNTLNITNITNLTNESLIRSARNMTIDAASVANNGSIESTGGSLTFGAKDKLISIDNGVSAKLFAHSNLNLHVDSIDKLVQGDNNINANGLVDVYTKGDINNTKKFIVGGGLKITTDGKITNNNVIAGNGLNINANNLDNRGTLFSGGDMAANVNNLTNNKDALIHAVGKMDITGGGSAAVISNNEARISTSNGDITISDFGKFDNDSNLSDSDIISTNISSSAKVFVPADNKCGGKYHCTQITTTKTETANNISAPNPAILYSGNNLTFKNIGTIDNLSGSKIVAKKNIEFDNVSTVNNANIELTTTVTVETEKDICTGADYIGNLIVGTDDYDRCIEKDTSSSSTSVSKATGYIGAGGSITGNVGTINNQGTLSAGAITTNYSNSNAGSTATGLLDTYKNVNANIGNNSYVGDTMINNIKLPEDDLSLFIMVKSPKSEYLIETNPEFTAYANFISSNYFVEKIKGQDPQGAKDIANMQRLGDAFYEQDLISQQIFNQTGSVFLDSQFTDNNAQYKYLMDNALLAQQDLDLSLGISLSSNQINQLQNDIVWMEKKIISGKVVLVPVVYMASKANYAVESGAIVRNNINLNVGNLNNTGVMSATGVVDINASEAIVNNGSGSISGGSGVVLTAVNNVNIAGQIKGGEQGVAIESLKGSAFLSGAKIESDGDLSVRAKQGSIDGSGVTASAKGVLELDAKNIDIRNTYNESREEYTDSEGYEITKDKKTVVKSLLSGDGGVVVKVAEKAKFTGTDINSKEGEFKFTGKDLEMKHAYNEEKISTKDRNITKVDIGFLSFGVNHKKDSYKESKEIAEKSTINAKNGVTINATGDVLLEGTDVITEGDVNVSAENFKIKNAYDKIQRHSKSTETDLRIGPHNTDVDIEKTSITTELFSFGVVDKDIKNNKKLANKSKLSANNININVKSDNSNKGNIVLEGVNVTAKNDVNLSASNKVEILDAIDTETEVANINSSRIALKVGASHAIGGIVSKAKDTMQEAYDATENLAEVIKQQVEYAAMMAQIKSKITSMKNNPNKSDEEMEELAQIKSAYAEFLLMAPMQAAAVATAGKRERDAITSLASVYTTFSSSVDDFVRTGGFNAEAAVTLKNNFTKSVNQYTTSNGSNINAGGNVVIKSNVANIRGSNVKSAGDIIIHSDEVNILAGKNTSKSNSTTVASAGSIGFGGDVHTSGKIKLSTFNVKASGSVNLSNAKSNTQKHVNNNLSSGGNFEIKSKKTNILGSNIASKGDIKIHSDELNISVGENKSNSSKVAGNVAGSVSFGGLDVADLDVGINASAGYSNANSKSNKVVSNKISGGGNLEIISNKTTIYGTNVAVKKDVSIKGDEVNILAAANESNSNSAKYNAKGSFSFNTGVDGFKAGASGSIANAQSSSKKYINNKISAGGNLIIEADKTNIRGSEITAKKDLSIHSNEINITANENRSNSSGTEYSASGSVGVGADSLLSAASIKAGAGYSNSSSRTYTGNKLSGNNINLYARDGKSESNSVKITGSTLQANKKLAIKTKNLDVQSLKNVARGGTFGINGGVSIGITDEELDSIKGDIGGKYMHLNNESLSKARLSANNIDIAVSGDTNLAAAVIASKSDGMFSTKSLTTSNIYTKNRLLNLGGTLKGNVGITDDSNTYGGSVAVNSNLSNSMIKHSTTINNNIKLNILDKNNNKNSINTDTDNASSVIFKGTAAGGSHEYSFKDVKVENKK